MEAFDGAERAPLTLDQIATLEAGSRLALQPHLQLVALSYPADELVLSLHHGEKRGVSEAGLQQEAASDAPVVLPKLRKQPTWLAVHRVDLSIFYRRLMRQEFQMLAALQGGALLAEALVAGFAVSSIPESRRPRLVQQWFSNWAGLGWICTPEPDSYL